jgi:hypothetical protein
VSIGGHLSSGPTELVLRALEELNGLLVFLRRSFGFEGSKVSAFAGLWIFFPRIQSVLTGCEFSNHT